MSCVLRVDGCKLNLNECLADTSLPPDSKYRKGESRRGLKKSGKLNNSSGFTFLTSDHDDIPVQIKDTLVFLRENYSWLKKLSSRSDVEYTTLDFSWHFPVGENGPMAQFRNFPPDLLRLCGDLNMGIEVSVYATEEEEEKDT